MKLNTKMQHTKQK